MLGQEASAWLVYTILFSIFFITLTMQSLSHWRITPFALYSACVSGGSLYVLLTPDFSRLDIQWRDQEPIINQLPVYSVLIFAGIVDWQFVYIKFIATALRNHRRWGSLHSAIITEKEDATSGNIIDTITISSSDSDPEEMDYYTHNMMIAASDLDEVYSISSSSSSLTFSNWTFWIYILAVLVHIIAILAFLICKALIDDPETDALISAILITIMTIPAILNAMAVLYTGSRCHSKLVSRLIGQNRQDAIILFLIPILFLYVMSSTTIIAWIAYTRPDPLLRPFDNNLADWILVKAISVYFPLSLLLACSLFKKKKYNYLLQDNSSRPSNTKRARRSSSLILKDRLRLSNKRISRL